MPFIKRYSFVKIISNRTFWLLTFSDLFTWGFYIIIATLSGIYLTHKLDQDVVKIVGIGGALYYIIRGTLQIPLSIMLDRIKFDKDEIVILTLGSIMMGLPFLFYPGIDSASDYYLLQIIFSFGVAMNVNPWRKLFAQNLDVGTEAKEYAIYDLVNSFFIAISILLVGEIANISLELFDLMMQLLGLLVMVGGIWSILIKTDNKRKSRTLAQ